jgi:uncharacterized protein (TIGR00255 family)
MTGFGRATFEIDGFALRLELRSVNNRFVDLRMHLPWPDGELEQQIRGAVRGRLERGRVDLTITAAEETPALRLNTALARDLAAVVEELAEILGDQRVAAQLLPSQRELVSVTPVAPPGETVWQALEPALKEALDGLLAMRQGEGAALEADLRQHLANLGRIRRDVAASSDEEPDRRAEKLRERVARLAADLTAVDPERLAVEVALLADRCDISEELVRLDSHCHQIEGMLDKGGAVGRQLEFMLQELNREFNTIGSKSGQPQIGSLVVEAKACLEKMREQAQNVE